MTKPPKPLMARVDRLLANLGYGSRREVQHLVLTRRVVLDGATLRDSGAKIAVTADLPQRMTINGAPIDPPAPLTLVMHKPLGVVCSHRETGRSVYDLLPQRWRAREPALSTIGRLDKETSGLLLITDDGPLLHRIISPRAKVAKRYVAELDRPLRGDEAAIFAAGTLILEGERDALAPAVLEPLGEKTARLTITEGRYHQVRRMFAAVGNHVNGLHRDQVGGLQLDPGLEPGAWRIMQPEDVSRVFAGLAD